jgi:LacI family transcriptional regulator
MTTKPTKATKPRKPAASRARIADVARRARVSVGTVSHVLTGRTNVSESLKARVNKAIEDLGYVPNFHAQGLRRPRSHAIGICFPHASTAYLNALSTEVEDIAAAAGYAVMHVFSRHDPAVELARINELIRYRVDGLILLPSPTPSRALDLAARKDVPLVIIDRPIHDARFDQVTLDNRRAMREVVERLAALGHRRVLFVCHSRNRLVTQHRLAGLEAARRAFHIAIQTIEFRNDTDFLRTELAHALNGADAPTAVIVSNSSQASLVLRYFGDAGVRYPADVSFVTFDDPEWSTLVRPSISVVRQPASAMARAAWDLLMQRIDRVPEPVRVVALAPSIEFRDSVAAVADTRKLGDVVPLKSARGR